MPEAQVRQLAGAFTEYRKSLDPMDEWSNRRLATVIGAADAAGWSRRTTAAALGISRERVQRIASFPAAAQYRMPRYKPGATFPAAAVVAFRKSEDEVRDRRVRAERDLVATLRSAHHTSGWPFNVLAAMVGASDERLRQIAESGTDTAGVQVPKFDAFTRVLKERKTVSPRAHLGESDREQLRRLADHARTATKSVTFERSLAARQASEELSALLVRLKGLPVTWPELDEACGYKPGGARARALRHGYAQAPPSMITYTRTPEAAPLGQSPNPSLT